MIFIYIIATLYTIVATFSFWALVDGLDPWHKVLSVAVVSALWGPLAAFAVVTGKPWGEK